MNQPIDISQYDISLCIPGKACLNCPFPDCIMPNAAKTHEETEMFRCSELPDGRGRKKRTRKSEF